MESGGVACGTTVSDGRSGAGEDDGDDFVRLETKQLGFLNLQRRDEFLQERSAVRGFRTSADLEFVVFVCLIFGRFFAEQSPNRFTKRELGSCADGFPVWKSVSAQIVDLNAQLSERGNAAGEFFDDLWLGPAAYGFGGFARAMRRAPLVKKSIRGVCPDKQSLLFVVAAGGRGRVTALSQPTRRRPCPLRRTSSGGCGRRAASVCWTSMSRASPVKGFFQERQSLPNEAATVQVGSRVLDIRMMISRLLSPVGGRPFQDR